MLKLFPTRIPIAAGNTMIAEINKAPAIGIIIAIATPVTTLKIIDIIRTGRPSTAAMSSSKVNTYIGRLNSRNKIPTKTKRIPKKITCCQVIVTIEPNRYDWMLTAELPGARLINTNAMARPAAIKIAMEISE